MERKVIPTSSTSFTLSTYLSMNDGCLSDFFQQVTLAHLGPCHYFRMQVPPTVGEFVHMFCFVLE